MDFANAIAVGAVVGLAAGRLDRLENRIEKRIDKLEDRVLGIGDAVGRRAREPHDLEGAN